MYITSFLALVASGYVLHESMRFNQSDQRVIKETFENIGYSLKGKSPRFSFKSNGNGYTLYAYSLPHGMIDLPKLDLILEKTLNRPINVSMKNKKLFIKVYNESLKNFFKYDWGDTKEIPIGKGLDGTVYHDFDKIPHMSIAGMTRQGKTVLLKLILAHLINNQDDVEIFIIDLKGGLEFSRYKKLKQVKVLADDMDSTKNLLNSITSQMDDDMSIFQSRGYNNITNTGIKRRRFILVDEGAELDKECQCYLSRIARIGGALGYRLIFSTQYPTGDTLPRQIKQNADAKITFRLPTEVASRVAIDEKGAEELEMPGRAIYRTHKKQIIQVPYITDKEIEKNLRRYKDDTAKAKTKAGGEDIITFT